MSDSATVIIICAASGLEWAWKEMQGMSPDKRRRATALLALDPAPHPTAAIAMAQSLRDDNPLVHAAAITTILGSIADDDIRCAILRHAVDAPEIVRHIADRGWESLNPAERRLLVNAALRFTDDACAITVIKRLGEDELRALADEERDALVRIAACAPCMNVPDSGRPKASAALALPPDRRAALLEEARREPWLAAAFFVEGAGLADRSSEEQDILLRSITCNPNASADAFASMTAEERMALHPDVRAALTTAIARTSASSSYAIEMLGPAGMAALSESDRAAMLAAVAANADDAAAAAIFVGAVLNESERRRLRDGVLGAHARAHIAHALSAGALRRDWMHDYIPDANAPDDDLAAWRNIAQWLPPSIAQLVGSCPINQGPRSTRRVARNRTG